MQLIMNFYKIQKNRQVCVSLAVFKHILIINQNKNLTKMKNGTQMQ